RLRRRLEPASLRRARCGPFVLLPSPRRESVRGCCGPPSALRAAVSEAPEAAQRTGRSGERPPGGGPPPAALRAAATEAREAAQRTGRSGERPRAEYRRPQRARPETTRSGAC